MCWFEEQHTCYKEASVCKLLQGLFSWKEEEERSTGGGGGGENKAAAA